MAIPIDLVTWTVPRPRPSAWRYDAAMTAPTSLPFTGDPEADRLIATDPLALLIGFALDQQVTVQKAFSGPRDIKRRLGHLDAAKIAAMPPDALDAVFREQPAIHRFPGSMAGKVQSLCAAIASGLRQRRGAGLEARRPTARTSSGDCWRCRGSAR